METIFQWARALMFFIDNIVYSLIGSLYELIIYLANLDLVTNNSVLHELVSRIYLLLGIFMLFKVAFSMIQYLIDPNSFSDSSKGFGKLVTNLLVSIVLLVSVPFIFQEAYKLQGLIIENNTINRLILGEGQNASESYVQQYETDEDTTTAAQVRRMAVDVQFTLFSAFYTLNTDVGDESSVPECAPDNPNYRNSNVIGSSDMVLKDDGACLEAFAEASAQEMQNYGVKLTDFFKTADSSGKISDERKFSSFGQLVFWKIGGSGSEFTINYTPVISTIVGAYLVFLLLAYAVDIAARAIKLMFLQMVAPIAIVSYVDPKESISNGKLNAWAKETFSTYISLFLRLAIIFLAIRLVSMITSMLFYPIDAAMDALTGSNNATNNILFYNGLEPQGTMNMFVYVFLVLGIFSFAKEFPKMLEKIFGISGSGNLSLNPLKSVKENGLGTLFGFGGAALGGMALGGIGNTVANLKKNKDLKDKLASGKITQDEFNKQHRGVVSLFGSAVGGMGSGMLRSARIGAKSQNPFTAAAQGVKASSNQRRAREAGYGFVQNVRDKWTDMAGIPGSYGTTSEIKDKIKSLTQRQANARRDETMAAYQMQQIMSQDKSKMASFRAAFKEDKEGGLVYKDYESFFKDQMNNYGDLGQMGIEEFDRLKRTETDSQELGRKLDLLAGNYNGLISNSDYMNYNSAREAREEADKLGKSLERDIERLNETKGFKKEVGKKA